MSPKIGRIHESGNDQTSLADRMGNREIESLYPNSKTENIDLFLKKIFKGESKEVFDTSRNDYLNALEGNTARSQEEMHEAGNYDDYSQEELEYIWENDPQYVNEKVYRPLPGTNPENIEIQSSNSEDVMDTDSLYMTDGLHGDHNKKGLINWKIDSVPGTEVEVEIPPGTLLKRYGLDWGHYLTDIETKFENLNLPSDRFKATNYIVMKPLGAVKSTIADQPFSMRQPDSPKASQYKTEMSVAELIAKGFLKKLDDGGDKVKIGHCSNEGAEQKRGDIHENSCERAERHLDRKSLIGDLIKNSFLKREGSERQDQGGEQKMGIADKLKALFAKEKDDTREDQNIESEKPEKSDHEKFVDSLKVDNNGEYVENRENKSDKKNDDNPDDNDQMNESRNESGKTNDFRDSLKVKVDPHAHLTIKDTSQREPGGRVPGPSNNRYFDNEAER